MREELGEGVVVAATDRIRRVATTDRVATDPNTVKSNRPANRLWTNQKIAP